MKYTVILLALLTGCVGTPVKQKFPVAPPSLIQPCDQLKTVPNGTTQLSQVLGIVVDNYSSYHECKIKVDSWNDWYLQQKKIFEAQ
jgi:hypothetical protein